MILPIKIKDMHHTDYSFALARYKNTIKIMQDQIESLEKMAEEITSQLDNVNLSPNERMEIQFQLTQYDRAKESAQGMLDECIIQRKMACN